MPLLGLIDVGTNSIHLVIGRRHPSGRWVPRLHRRAPVRLGDDGWARGRLTAAAMRRAMRILARYAAIASRRRVRRVEAVATGAVREAANGAAFARRVRAELGVPLRILSGAEEARLTFLGVQQVHRRRGPVLLVAIGGGSAQVVVGSGRRLRYCASVPIGAARLAQRFIRHDPPRPREIAALWAAARRAWGPLGRRVRRLRWRRAVGSSAMIQQVMAVAGRSRALTQSRLRAVVNRLARARRRARRRWPGVDPGRDDLLLPTAVALLEWMAACRAPRLTYAAGSLREGLAAQLSPAHGTC
ncbi:MAG: hypothetical protein HY600_01190 [Candidatus Omnitrophica bacterium]|nr:hypothetical protein [Candidatus Omnitrophota bacterium]